MAGHSKWKNIQFRKGAQDAKRGKLFTKFIREITVAARMGGGDLASNPRLRAAWDKALSANMTKETIERAVKRGVGGEDGAVLEEIRYEGYGPFGVAVLVETLTDNRNRTVSEVRHLFSKQGGQLGTEGSVTYLFKKRGELYFPPGVDEQRLLEVALENGADDVQAEPDGAQLILIAPAGFLALREALIAAQLVPAEAEVAWCPDLKVALDRESAEKILKMVDALEDLDDVQNVYTNADIPDALLEEIYA